MKVLWNRRNAGILFLLLILLPYVFILPSMATSHTIYDNYESETSSGEINIYYQSGSAFQYVQEMRNITDTTLRIIAGATFYYHTYADTVIKVQAVDDSSSVIASSSNLDIYNSSGNKNDYTHYFLEDPYLTSRGNHLIRLIGVSSAPTSIHYTGIESGYSYYSNESTGMGSWALDSKQYFIQFIEEEIVNLTRNENRTGRFEWKLNVNNDAIDAYLLDIPAQPVKIILDIESAGKTLILELYNYTNNGDMALQNSTVTTSGHTNPVILTYIPPTPGLHVLLIKPADFFNDQTNYSIQWINSSNEITVTHPTINFDNSTMDLDISGVYASMDGYTYNGTSYQPEKAEYTIYREIDDSIAWQNGSLTDSDGNGEWSKLNLDVTGLNPGAYYVRANFEDNNGNAVGTSPKSNRFFVLGNLSVSAATISYIGGMTQKIDITGITVDNSTSLDVFTYSIYDSTLKGNSSLTGNLVYNSISQTWNASNIDVSTLYDGSYFVLGYFEDYSTNMYGIGNVSPSTLDIFTVEHLIEVNQVYVSYTDQWTQQLEIGGLANTSFQGYGVGRPIQENDSIASFQIYYTLCGCPRLSGKLSWTGSSWNTSIIAANLTEGYHYVQLSFTNNSQFYNTSGSLDSSTFWVEHILNITSLSFSYLGNESQIATVEVQANTSYYGNGIGTPIEENEDAVVLCTIVNNSNLELTPVTGLATWSEASSSWKADISTASLPEGEYYVMVNFSVISSLYNASATRNTTGSFTIKHVITLYVPTPIFNPDIATVDIIGIIATDSFMGYHHINDTTVLSTYFEMFNYTSHESLGIYGGLTYNSTFDDWRNTSIDLSMYPESIFYIHVNITSIDVEEGAAINSSPFNVVHKIIITGISLEYIGGFNQTLNITVAHAESTFQNHTQANITHHNYRFYYRNNQTAVQNPNLGGNLTYTGSNWQALVNMTTLPAGEYYAMVNFADPTAATSKGSKDTTNFTVVHSLNVSTPIINYINNMDQHLNISCFVNSTYYLHRNFDSSDYGSGYYRIYLNNGNSTSITGNLEWNGTRWIAINADASLLSVGDYRLLCNFTSYYATANSSLSVIFTVTHVINITGPTITFNNNTKTLNMLHITAQSSYSGHGYLTNLTALVSYFEIFDILNQTTGISGQLSWNGSEWQAINFASPSLEEGQYYLKIYFNDSQTSITEISSDIFTARYPEEGIDWVIIFIIILIALAVAIVLFWSFFPKEAEVGSEQS
ncbi:MAG: hypothetical protein HWN66_03590 [Candidatus Helarchaeota archaeon]|nr:hypothetical protein [Candidatus Helarchaeota archaeon]